MRPFMTALSIVVALLCPGASIAQHQGYLEYSRNFLEYAKVQRADGLVTCVANSSRPLNQALDAISEEYGWSVDYEDPPYQSSLELIDVTSPVWRAAHPTSESRALGIRGGAFRTTYPESPATATSAEQRLIVLRQIVADYNASGNPGQFAVREFAGGRLGIVGTSVKDESGNQIPTPSVLDTPVTVRGGSMNLGEAVDIILEALNVKTATKLGASLPTNLMFQTQVKLPEGEMPARDALHQVLAQAKGKLYWRLLYGPGRQAYGFNVLIARRVQYDTFGTRHLELIR
jgi:hypothetical protein